MKIRVRLDYSGNKFIVEQRKYIFKWETIDWYYVDPTNPQIAEESAIKVAQRLLNPVIVFEGEN